MIGRARAVERGLRDATALAAEGRRLEAIDDLTQLNRAKRDPRIEQRLVELRHAAFAELPGVAGRPEWPPVLGDPFPDERDLPAIDAHELSGALVGGSITNHGCLRVNALLDPATVDRIIDLIERGFEGRDRLAKGADLADVGPGYVPFAAGWEEANGFSSPYFIRVVDAPGAMFEILEQFHAQGVVSSVAEYLGERPTMIANKWVLRRAPGGANTTDFHQDGAFLGEGVRTVDCWITLTDCGPGTDRPALEIIPRRFEEILPTGAGAKFHWTLAESTVMEAAPEVSVSRPRLSAGDALFFDERLPHRTTNGPELGIRYAIESWFVAPSSSYARHEPIVI